MNDLAIARALHVIAVILWIGGVAMVTTVLLPATRRMVEERRRVAFFEMLEGRFAMQARATTLVAGATGFYLVVKLDLWARFAMAGFWWMHAMVAVWLLFSLMLFVLEPIWLHRWFQQRATAHPGSTFDLISRLHWLLMLVSLVTAGGAMVGVHGGF